MGDASLAVAVTRVGAALLWTCHRRDEDKATNGWNGIDVRGKKNSSYSEGRQTPFPVNWLLGNFKV